MSTVLEAGPTAADFAAIKTRQQAAWASGDYAVVGTTLQIVGENLAEALDLRAGSRVIDIAAGNGNATLAAARRLCSVMSTDYVPALLDKGRERAAAERLEVEFRTADAEQLPFDDASFDVAMSVFGVMFTPEHRRAAQEMARVTRPGGLIGLASWTPDSFIGQLFRLLGSYVPPPPGLRSPALWGTEAHLHEIFGPAIGELRATRRQFVFRYRSAEHFIDVFRRYYGPVHKAFLALPADRQASLEQDLHALIVRCSRTRDTVVAAQRLPRSGHHPRLTTHQGLAMKFIPLLLAAAVGMLVATPTRADAVTDWNTKVVDLINEAKMGTPPAHRLMAITQTAVARGGRDDRAAPSRRLDGRGRRGGQPRRRAKALPAQQAAIDKAYETALAAIADGPAKAAGIDVGERAAASVLAARRDDGVAAADTYRPQTAAGAYVPTVLPAVPQWPQRKPWLMASADAVPPGRAARAGQRDLGARLQRDQGASARSSSTRRSAEQTEAAVFWEATLPSDLPRRRALGGQRPGPRPGRATRGSSPRSRRRWTMR